MFSFFSSNRDSELDSLAKSNDALASSPTKETPLGEAPEAKLGDNTTCLNFAVTTRLGWVAWKDTEAALYGIFERSFAATRCELKISDDLKDIALEVEIPNDQVEKFTKYFKGKALAMEIDKLHGIEPSLARFTDVRFSQLTKTLGSTVAGTRMTSSVDVLQRRMDALEACGVARQKEVDAINELTRTLYSDLRTRYDMLKEKLETLAYEKCISKFETVEDQILAVVRNDLAFLGTTLPFQFSQGNLPRNRLEETLKAVRNGLVDGSVGSGNMSRAGSSVPRPLSPALSDASQAPSSSNESTRTSPYVKPAALSVQITKSSVASTPLSHIRSGMNTPQIRSPLVRSASVPPPPPQDEEEEHDLVQEEQGSQTYRAESNDNRLKVASGHGHSRSRSQPGPERPIPRTSVPIKVPAVVAPVPVDLEELPIVSDSSIKDIAFKSSQKHLSAESDFFSQTVETHKDPVPSPKPSETQSQALPESIFIISDESPSSSLERIARERQEEQEEARRHQFAETPEPMFVNNHWG